MELIIATFLTVLFIVLALSLWMNRQAAEGQRQRAAAARLAGDWSAAPAAAPGGVRRDPPRGAAAGWHPVLRWADDALAQTGLELAPQTLLGGLLALAVGSAALATLWLPTSTALAAGLGSVALPVLWLRRRRQQRLQLLARQIPYLLDTLKAAIEAGHTLLRGLQMAAQNSPAPLADELRVLVDQVRVGMSLPLALEAMCRRVPIDELTFLADAVGVQEETGSSLAEILLHVAQSIRNRQRLDDQIRVLTSQSRLSATIVSALPSVILAVFSLVRGDYTDVLFHDPIGIRLLEAAIAMDLVAFFIMREIARVDY